MHAAIHPSRLRRAFSLIEVLGVLSVITILSLALVPALIAGYDRTARERESRALEEMAEGLRSHILRNRNIPDHTTIAAALATELGRQIGTVMTNERGLPRLYVIDPAITNTLPMPFVQTPFGIATNVNPNLGVLFLSSISAPLPVNLTNGFAPGSAAFSNLWNTADGQVPAGWSWAGRGEDLRIQRVNLGTLFVPVILNYDTYTVALTNQGRFTIGNSTTNILPTSPTYVAHYLEGSVLGLHHHAGTTNTLQATEVIKHPMSFVYERDAWRGQLFLGRGFRLTTGMDVQAAHDLFLAAPTNANAKNAADQVAVVNALSNYLRAFLEWRGPPEDPSRAKALADAQSQLESVTVDMIFKPSSGK